ncbi:isoflavone reductase [Acrasis kona]|uniref:Isoflavone reductase n=1 Tax=Acrasis kona TaxID=1008807 RepID=A0AAW2YNG5_9EUKA
MNEGSTGTSSTSPLYKPGKNKSLKNLIKIPGRRSKSLLQTLLRTKTKQDNSLPYLNTNFKQLDTPALEETSKNDTEGYHNMCESEYFESMILNDDLERRKLLKLAYLQYREGCVLAWEDIKIWKELIGDDLERMHLEMMRSYYYKTTQITQNLRVSMHHAIKSALLSNDPKLTTILMNGASAMAVEESLKVYKQQLGGEERSLQRAKTVPVIGSQKITTKLGWNTLREVITPRRVNSK